MTEPRAQEPAALAQRAAEAALSAAARRAPAFPWLDPAAAPAGDGSDAQDIDALLRGGPADAAASARLAALIAAGAEAHLAADPGETVARLAWLSAHTPCDPLAHLDRAAGADTIWTALARVVTAPGALGLGRAEALVAAAALAAHAPALAAEVRDATADATLRRLLAAAGATEGDLPGECVAPPRGPVATVLLALTGWLLVAAITRAVARIALGLRRPATLRVTSRGVEIEHRVELLGRVLRERTAVLPFSALASVTREVRFARAGLYAGLLALALGSYLGTGLFVDGVRVPGTSPSLLGLALLVVAAGVVLDFALTAVSDSSRRRCRIVVRPTKGPPHCVGGVDCARADGVLRAVAERAPG